MKIAVYTCVLNEAKHAERWAESAKCADYMVWLDTGSTDDTVALAVANGITVHEAVFKPFRFDDARNAAMALVPADCDVMIQLDADEVFTEPDWRKHFDANPGHERYSYWLTNDGGSWGRVKRQNAHVRDGYRWEHPIHEVIKGSWATCHLDEVVIEHRPDKGKSRAYALGMLEHWSAEFPDDARTLFYLGREYKFRAMWDKARVALWKYIHHDKATWGPERQEAYMMLAQIDSHPERYYWKAVAEEPARREPFYYLAKHHLRRNENDLAWSMVLQAAARTDYSIYTTHAEAWGEPFDEFFKKVEAKQ